MSRFRKSFIYGDYHQGSDIFSDISIGRQCVPNCISFILFTTINPVSNWTTEDLNCTLHEGDAMYKHICQTLNISPRFLTVSELPTLLQVGGSIFKLNNGIDQLIYSGNLKSQLYYVDTSIMCLEFAINLIFHSAVHNQACIVIFCDCAIAIIKDGNRYAVYDPHSRNEFGFCSGDGKCLVSFHDNLQSLCSFLRNLCGTLTTSELQEIQYDMVCIKLTKAKPSTKKNHSYKIKLPPKKKPLDKNNMNFPIVQLNRVHTDLKNREKGNGSSVKRTLSSSTIHTYTDINTKRRKISTDTGLLHILHESEAENKMFSNVSTCTPKNIENKNIASDEGVIMSKRSCSLKDDTPSDMTSKQRVKNKGSNAATGNNNPEIELIQVSEPFIISNAEISVADNTCTNIENQNANLSSYNVGRQTCTIVNDLEKLQECFQLSVNKGPSYVCTSCNQTWFTESVSLATSLKCDKSLLRRCTSGLVSVDNKEWVCRTCKKYLDTGKVPECSVGNGMKFPDIPTELQGLTDLEERLISPRIPFMVIRQQPRGGQLSLKGNVVNVPADIQKTVRSLPRMLNDDETINIKFKRKTSYQHCVAHEMVRPNKIVNAVNYLVKTALFKSEGISLNENWLDSNNIMPPVNVGNNNVVEHPPRDPNYNEDTNNDSDSDNWTEETDLDRRNTGNMDTVLQPVDFREFGKTLNLAPGEGNTPLGIYQDINSEFLSFPTIYCGQSRMPNNKRVVPLHYSTISKWELRHYDRRVALSIPNIFFKLKKIQLKLLQDKIQLAMRKCKLQGKKITVQDVLAPGAADTFVRHKEGYQILRNLRGSPAYWEAAKKDLFALIKQLGIPAWFCSLSAAETHWLSLLQCLGRLVDHTEYSELQINLMPWQEKCRLIKSDPVTCARYFDYRVQKFFKDILMDELVKPLGEVTDYFYRVEFQQRGSPHIHMVLWVKNAPDISNDQDERIEQFIDDHITCLKQPDLINLLAYQTHRHARTCRKKGKSICRFNFPQPPMSKTRILQPMSAGEREEASDCANIYGKITKKLDEYKSGSDISYEDFLIELKLKESEYIKAIRWSMTRPRVFLKRELSEIRINSYNPVMLKCWSANIDVQFILDAYSCAAYIVSYVSKGQRGMSNLMYRAVKECRENNFSIQQEIRCVSNKFLTHVEIGAQEAVYLVLQMPLRKSSRKVIFINTSPPQERLILLKSYSDLEDMSKSSTDVESDNWIKRYERRPKALDKWCLADFVSWFEISYQKEKLKRQVVTEIDLPETNDIENEDDNPHDPNEHELSEAIQSRTEYNMADGGILRKRQFQKVLRYVRYNEKNDPTNHYRELIMLFHHWRKEVNDIPTSLQEVYALYKHHENTIKETRNAYERNRKVLEIVEMNAENRDDNDESIDTQFMPECLHTDEQDMYEGQTLTERYGCFDPGKQLTHDVGADMGVTRKQIEDDDYMLNKIPESQYRQIVSTLNNEQKVFFYHILHWFKIKTDPLYNFLSGGAGVGKSVVTKAIYQALIRCLNAYPGANPDEVKVLLCAPTGKAAHNINGNTIHSTFCIPASKGFQYKPLDMEQLNVYRLKYKELKVVLIDEISMVGCKMFNFINCRLQEIMGTQSIFGGVSIIAIGDLYQLKPVMDNWIFSPFCNEYGFANLWQDNFTLYELQTVMRQQEDGEFANLLNRLREGLQSESDITVLQSRVIEFESDTIQEYQHLYTTRAEVEQFNNKIFELSTTKNAYIESIDIVTGDVDITLHKTILEKIPQNDPSKTMGLQTILKLAENLNADICTNISIEDGLTNGASCCIKFLDYRVEGSKRCSIIWVLFDDVNIGMQQRQKYSYLRNTNVEPSWTPVFEITRKFRVGYNSGYQIIRRQFPLRLSAAKTIHKSQGSTLNNVVVNFSNRKNCHMHYVGLSRVRSLSGLHILNLYEEKISVSTDVMIEMDRLRSTANLSLVIPTLSYSENMITIVFHNIRSLHLHIHELKKENNILQSDAIGIAETRLHLADQDGDYGLPNFTIYRNDCEARPGARPYHGSVVYGRNCVTFEKKITYRQIEVTSVIICKNNFRLRALFIYSPPKIASGNNFKLLLDSLACTIPLGEKTVILGDFNIDSQKDDVLKKIFSNLNYTELPIHITTDYQSSLDRIFTNIENDDLKYGALESYYSDHKPIYMCLPV